MDEQQGRIIDKVRKKSVWIPAFAGMTRGVWIPDHPPSVA
jgi:hypothetical protein